MTALRQVHKFLDLLAWRGSLIDHTHTYTHVHTHTCESSCAYDLFVTSAMEARLGQMVMQLPLLTRTRPLRAMSCREKVPLPEATMLGGNPAPRTGRPWARWSAALGFAAQAPTTGATRLHMTPAPSHRVIGASSLGPRCCGAETGHPHWLFPKTSLSHA